MVNLEPVFSSSKSFLNDRKEPNERAAGVYIVQKAVARV
jgi:hypothetical protein